MDSLNLRVITSIADWLASGASCWLATVVQTYGSSPRPVGSLLAYQADYGAVGSLSGGCVEEDLLASLRRPQHQPAPKLLRYGTTEDERLRYGLPCGGELRVLLEWIEPSADHQHQYAQLAAALRARRPALRRVDLVSGRQQVQLDRSASFRCSATQLQHPLNPTQRLLLVGAGEVAQYVAQFAPALDFDVSLCEPREAFLQAWKMSDVEVLQRLPDDLIRERFNDPQSAVLALAHDPRIDDMALLEALQSAAFYVGAMGSMLTSRQRRQRLLELGLSADQVARLHAPIGLDIGSKTPAEIALSILAHVVAERSRLRNALNNADADLIGNSDAGRGCALVNLNANAE